MAGGALVVALLMTGPIVTFEWTEPAGGTAVDYYEVEYVEEQRDPEVLTTFEPSISLAPQLGRGFEIRVRACTGNVCSDWSELSQAVSLNRSADLTGDGIVGLPDYVRFGQAMRRQEIDADLNGDAVVGLPDFSEFAEHWGACVGAVDIEGLEVPAYAPCNR